MRATTYKLFTLALSALPLFGANFTVTDTSDSPSDPGSLRYAINNLAAMNITNITFSVTGTISLTGGQFEIPSGVNVAITGPGPNAFNLIIDGGGASRIFQIDSGATATLKLLTIQNGSAPSGTNGGGILNNGHLTVIDSIISNNQASLAGQSGGGIFNGGVVTVDHSTVSGNTASSGGGIEVAAGSTATFTNSTLYGNTALAVFPAGGGAAVDCEGNCTVTFNSSTLGPNTPTGTFMLRTLGAPNPVIQMNDTLIVGGGIVIKGGPSPVFTSNQHNFSNALDVWCTGTDSCGDSTLTLGPLQDNGGPTPTAALLSGDAIDAIPIASCPLDDQRHFPRPDNGPVACDAGAYESGVVNFSLLSGNNSFTGNQTVDGTVNATLFVGNGSGLTGVNAATATTASSLGGIPAASYARLDIGNALNGNQTITGNVSISGALTVGGATPIVGLSASFNPNFPALKAFACATATFTLTGAGDGDPLALGVPNERMVGGATVLYTAWVSSANTVTIQACNINPTVAQKTAGSGAIRVVDLK